MRQIEMLISARLMVGIGRYLYREPDRPMDAALLQEYLEPVEVYEKRPPWCRGAGNRRRQVSEEARICLYAVQRGCQLFTIW